MFEDCKVELLETFGSDLTVVNAARVSLGKEVHEMGLGDEKLIKYLCDHNHNSPFFHPQARFRLKMPIWMAREWFRHTVGFARNEVSRRYVDSPPTFHLPLFVRGRAANKKQGSLEDAHHDNDLMISVLQESTRKSFEYYNALISSGVPPEQARMILPQNMMTEFIETASLAAYARLCSLRMSPDAQKEIQDVAASVCDVLSRAFPVSWKQLTHHTPTST